MNLIIFFFQRSSHVKTGITRTQTSRLLLFFTKVFFYSSWFKNDTNALVLDKVVKLFFFYVNSEKPACFDTLRECSSVRLIQVSLQLLINQKVSSLSRTNKTQMVTIIFDSKPTSVLCHMGDFGCGDGGWTPVMKMDGNKVRSSLCQALR